LPGRTGDAFAARIAERIGVRYDPDRCALILLLGLRDRLK
jgi:hypothetical protein